MIGTVPKHIAEKRLNVCKMCDEYIAFTSMCRKCGCILPLKTKLLNEKCPLGKWGNNTKKSS